jgi:hypothetical protein
MFRLQYSSVELNLRFSIHTSKKRNYQCRRATSILCKFCLSEAQLAR